MSGELSEMCYTPVLESRLGLESGLEMLFCCLGLVLDSLVFGLGLVSDSAIGLAKYSSWSQPSPALYACSNFLLQNKTIDEVRSFRKQVLVEFEINLE